MKHPTLGGKKKNSIDEYNVYKFCHNILNAHQMKVFGGKHALWDFIQDIARHLNRSDKGYRYSKCFAQVMKVYSAKQMCVLFALNFIGPSFSTIKRCLKKRGLVFTGLALQHLQSHFSNLCRC